MAHAAAGIEPALGEFAAGDHLGHDEPGAVLVSATAERLVGHTGHRREEHAVRSSTPPMTSGVASFAISVIA
jgi:hypothetical protein